MVVSTNISVNIGDPPTDSSVSTKGDNKVKIAVAIAVSLICVIIAIIASICVIRFWRGRESKIAMQR